MLDSIPAIWRHLLVLILVTPLAAFGITLFTAVVADGLATDFAGILYAGLNLAVITAASGALTWIALYVTPLTRQYGVGSSKE